MSATSVVSIENVSKIGEFGAKRYQPVLRLLRSKLLFCILLCLSSWYL